MLYSNQNEAGKDGKHLLYGRDPERWLLAAGHKGATMRHAAGTRDIWGEGKENRCQEHHPGTAHAENAEYMMHRAFDIQW